MVKKMALLNLYMRKNIETEEDQRTHGRGELRRSWEA